MIVGGRHWVVSLVTLGVLALTLHPGMAQATAFRRSERVRERIHTLPTEPKRIGMVVTVVAGPGDNIETSDATVRVNGQPIAGFSTELIATAAPSPRMPDRIPANQYLIMDESRDSLNNVVRKWGIYSRTDLERA